MNDTFMPYLRQGDTIGIFSPSNPITCDAPYAALKAEKYLTDKGFIVKKGKCYGKSESAYRSGTMRERANELNELIYDNDVKCIMAAAGGYVSDSILPYIDYEYLMEHPKIIVGLSDVTSVLLAVYEKCGFPVFYGPNYITSLAHNEYYSDFAFHSFLNAVNNRNTYTMNHPEFFTNENMNWYKSDKDFDEQIANEKLLSNKLITVKSGVAKGRLIGGNFDNFNLLYGTEYCPDIKDGDILFLEELGAEADFCERIFSSLYLKGIFDKIGGLILGKFKNYNDNESGKSHIDILFEIVKEPSFPVLADFDCGHTLPINTMPIGKQVILDAENKSVTVL